MVNRGGLLHDGRAELTAEPRVYAQPLSRVAAWARGSGNKIGLFDVIKNVRATVLIGLSTLADAFTEPIVREMAGKVERPIIDRKSTRLNSSHLVISYAVFCL